MSYFQRFLQVTPFGEEGGRGLIGGRITTWCIFFKCAIKCGSRLGVSTINFCPFEGAGGGGGGGEVVRGEEAYGFCAHENV